MLKVLTKTSKSGQLPLKISVSYLLRLLSDFAKSNNKEYFKVEYFVSGFFQNEKFFVIFELEQSYTFQALIITKILMQVL